MTYTIDWRVEKLHRGGKNTHVHTLVRIGIELHSFSSLMDILQSKACLKAVLANRIDWSVTACIYGSECLRNAKFLIFFLKSECPMISLIKG